MKGDHYVLLPSGVLAFGDGLREQNVDERVKSWQENITNMAFFLILAGSRTAEIEGISAAGSTPVSRRYTAVADAELLLRGPLFPKRWPLPPLPAGVSPALISYVASRFLKIKPTVISAGLLQSPPFSHVSLESPEIGPARCLSSGNAMEITRVKLLLDGGFKIGKKLKKSLLVTECVPGGTSTAFAVLSGLGINVNGLISGSYRNPPTELKKKLVNQGLKAANLKKKPSSVALMAAVGDPFQPIAVGLLMGAIESGQDVLLGGGCQMLAVLALALNEIEPKLRSEFVGKILIGTTSWLVDETLSSAKNRNSFIHLMDHVASHFKVNLLGLASGYRFNESNQKVLRDYEIGYVKEGVGAGALSLLAQIKGLTQKEMVERCDVEVGNLFKSKNEKTFHGI
ncbi:nicotinate-nucleotide--dimethylbenzimidazole phosphoribosyltransferase [Prochlorococcus sp. MIT 1011]|uniref:nicotinate-nucleotide--dimethylbenzimidazole phosphoribosyltransferase n=1 Tax=Prochlorococcus sp. MIT 1011 TaxID=3082520 RepID=UPI0039B60B11